jgi:Rgg/GadR/MutR family transcriptional activator
MQKKRGKMYGETIKQIRKSKNMTLKEVAGEALSVSQLSRFENEKSMIPVDLFYEVLENLNTTTEEYNYISDLQQYEVLDSYGKRIEKYNDEEDFKQLKALIKEIKETNPGIYSWEQFLIYFIQNILYMYDEVEDKADQPVLEYLMQVENWGEMELRLYAMFGFVLDVETTYILMRTALKRSKQYLDVPAASKLLYTILSNNFSTFLFSKNIDYAEETIQLFEEEYADNTDLLSPHIDFIFNKGLLAFVKKDLKKAKEYCEKAITTCKLFQQNELADIYESRYKGWVENPEYKELIIKVK